MIKGKLFLIVLLVVVGVIALAIYASATRLRLIETQPRDSATNIVSAEIAFTFSHDMAQSSLASTYGTLVNIVTITPAVTGKVETRSKSITFTPDQSLSGGQTYTAVLSRVTSAKGKTISDIKITFTTKEQTLDEKETALIKSLPYTGNDFVIDYIASSKTITIRIYADPAVTKKQAAYDYIISFGVDPDKARIDIFLGPDVAGGSSGP